MDRIRRAVWVVLAGTASGCGGSKTAAPPPEVATVTPSDPAPAPAEPASATTVNRVAKGGFDDDPDRPSPTDILGQTLDADTVRCTITWQKIPTPVDIRVTLKLHADGTAEREALEWITRPPRRAREPHCGRRPEGFALRDRSGVLEGMAQLDEVRHARTLFRLATSEGRRRAARGDGGAPRDLRSHCA